MDAHGLHSGPLNGISFVVPFEPGTNAHMGRNAAQGGPLTRPCYRYALNGLMMYRCP